MKVPLLNCSRRPVREQLRLAVEQILGWYSESRYIWLIRIVSLIAISAGVVARVLHFGSIPPGLNQDEAATGYEAWSLLHYGIDRNGLSWPVHLIAFGNGGNASFPYMAMPFVSFGLTPFTARLPMLVSALASLPLVWFISRKLFDEKAAWTATSVVALSPWHIMLSRWALDCNVLPFLFLCGLALLVASVSANRKLFWLIAACAMLGVSVYSYGAAYLAVPLFVLSSLMACVAGGIFTARQAFIGAAVFGITVLPIVLFVLVNLFQWDSIIIGGITIPRLPSPPRFATQLADGPLAHIGQFLNLVATQRDGLTYNVTDPYGVLYSSIFFILAIGLVAAIPIFVARRRWPLISLFISFWVIASIPIGIVQAPNINRINLLLMGLVVAAGLAISAIDRWLRGFLIIGLLSLLVPFGFFVRDYFTTQSERIAVDFFDGLVPALEYAQSTTAEGDMICVSGQINMPQVHTLFTEPRDPREYLRTVLYIDPTAQFRPVASYGRYTFGLERCDFEQARIVVARKGESVSAPFVKVTSFQLFDVYAEH